MKQHRFSATARIPATAQAVYAILADYHRGHQEILPRPHFIAMRVERGGTGAGTVVSFQMTLLGKVQSFRASIDEPEPGRLLRETDEASGAVTTFLVEPVPGGFCNVTITTETSVYNGVLGTVQGWLTARLLLPIYRKELSNLAAKAAGR